MFTRSRERVRQLQLFGDRYEACAARVDGRPSGRMPSLVSFDDPIQAVAYRILIVSSFNCLLPAHTCAQYAGCNEFNGKCDCPEGFGGDDCLEPRTKLNIPTNLYLVC